MITQIVDDLVKWAFEMLLLFVVLSILASISLVFAALYLRVKVKFRGAHSVICPLTAGPALIQVAAFRSAMHWMTGDDTPRVAECNLWPEHSGCARNCSTQLTQHP